MTPAERDIERLIAADEDPHSVYRRAQSGLTAAAAALTARGCLTPPGAAYLGVPFAPLSYIQLALFEH